MEYGAATTTTTAVAVKKPWKKPLIQKTGRKAGNRGDDDYTPSPPHAHGKEISTTTQPILRTRDEQDPRRHPNPRLHPRLVRPILHHDPRRTRRRGHHSRTTMGKHRTPRPRRDVQGDEQHLLRPQHEQEGHSHRHEAARGNRTRQGARQEIRRRSPELRHRRHGAPRPRLRGAEEAQT